uniref:ARID domain-containing protein n=1 Tax=Ganoderma boninense TaxID=34458 RepID=A0A5K1JX73_9APHY|nr:ARID domain-containing protein [Ganoderma boninense]
MSDAGGSALPFHLDPSTAKQMAALQATSLAKAANRSAPGGTSAAYFGGMSTNQSNSLSAPHDSHPFAPLPDLQAPNPHMNPPQPPQQPTNAAMQQEYAKQRKRSWLTGLANLMAQRGMPLPPQLTGVPFPPNYDPANMPWKSLEVSSTDLGFIRLAGKDIDLYRLWGLVTGNGGGQAVTQKGLWQSVRQTLDLPETMSSPNSIEPQLVVAILERYYTALIGPFEEAYRKNLMEQQQRARQQGNMNQRPGMVGIPGQNITLPGGNPSAVGVMPPTNHAMDGPLHGQLHIPQMPFQPPNMMGVGGGMATNGANHPAMNGAPMAKLVSGGYPPMPGVGPNGTADIEHDMENRKRKMQEAVESDAKREAQTYQTLAVQPPENVVTRTILQPSRRKIAYVPLAQELETMGGRNLDFIQNEWHRLASRPLRHSDEWGHVDIDALTLSLRSRISTELSYSLTTFALLTLARNQHSQQHGQREREGGFPIMQAPDLLDEAVDLIEDLAFSGVEDDENLEDDGPLVTHKDLVNTLMEDGSKPFAALQLGPGGKDPEHGPRQRQADIILTAVSIIRNISQGDEHSAQYLAKHEKLLHVLVRLCSLAPRSKSSGPVPLSPALSLSDLIALRKDLVHMVVNFGVFIGLLPTPVPSKQMQRTIRRAYAVMASFVVDPSETVSPFQYILQTGIQLTQPQPKPPAPPSLANQALEALARFTLSDDNRRAVAMSVPTAWLWTTFEALVHRLPVTDHDFHAIMREPWIGYVERLVLCLYAIAFLAPPELKERAKRNSTLGFSKIVLRLLKKFVLHTPVDSRNTFAFLVGRAIELLKLVDDAGDSFDPGNAAMPLLSFGMGYGEHGDNRVERGLGMLCAYQEDVTLGLMMHSELLDAALFSELESLVRVGR